MMPAPIKKVVENTTTRDTEPNVPSSSQRLRRDVRLGLNVIDLGRTGDYVRVRVIKTGEPRLNIPITYGEGGDERFVELTCDLLTAALLIDFVRNEGRVERSTVCRAYMKKGEGPWTKIGYDTILTRPEGDGFVLDEKVFPIEVEAVPYVGGKAERVLFRKRK